MKNYLSNGDKMPYTAGADVASGALVIVEDFAGVAEGAIANGATGVLQLTGVVTLPKASAATAIDQGEPCYHVSGEITHTDNSGANALVGYAWADAAADATTIQVRLKQ